MSSKRSKFVATVVSVLVLSLTLFTGTALAHGSGPGEGTPQAGPGGWTQQMQEWMGPELWGEMIQRMTQIHGPEFTGQMVQWMNETGGCHGDAQASGIGGSWDGMGNGFRGFQGFRSMGSGIWGSVMGMGRGMMGGFGH